MITPAQLRMARAALDLTTRQMGEAVGLSAMAISRYEKGDLSVMSVATALRMRDWLLDQRVFFGPADGVCLGQNAFAQERWLGLACYQFLRDHGIVPSSSDLLTAYARANGEPTP
jgi:transcriptional regulator with XRE-family HTH domain